MTRTRLIMKSLQSAIAVIALVIATQSMSAQEMTIIPPGTLAKYDSLLSTLKPATRTWIVEQGAKAQKVTGDAAAIEVSVRSAINTRFATNKLTNADVQTLLYLVVREALKENQKAKQSLLQKLKSHNDLAERISDVLNELADASRALATSENNAPCTLPSCANFKSRIDSVVVMQRSAGVATTPLDAIRTAGDLRARIRQLGQEMKELRNRRQMEQTAFEHLDKQTNQLMTLLSNIVRALAEMRTIGAASRSGL